jgi:hypothetical protein
MSLRAIPLLAIAYIMYVVLAATGVEFGHCVSTAEKVCANSYLFSVPMPSGAGVRWVFNWGDLVIIVTLVMLFIELLKSTYTTTSSLVDHALSMVVMIVGLITFLLMKQAATSVFFIILISTVIDVIAGYTIGIRVAKRDVSFGGGDN